MHGTLDREESSLEGKKKTVRILMIGNSHTYYNDMPLMVMRSAEDAGYRCDVTMIAHGGWTLAQHASEPDVRFNILYGHYDYVVLQEYAQPFVPEEQYLAAAASLTGMIRSAGSVPVLYETWARKDEPEKQAGMNEAHRRVGKAVGALLAPVGENWLEYQKNRPEVELYAADGGHASGAGSEFAAKHIWDTISLDLCAGRKE